jgi:LL-diaminopimelate aminotransferase
VPAPAERLQKLPPYVFAVLGQRIHGLMSQGMDIISLDIGSPDLPPPLAVIEALQQSAARPDRHGYSGYKGIPAFRQAVARYYQRRFGIALDPDHEVLPLIGSKEGIVNLALAYLDRGDVALVPDVGYPAYSMGARLAGADVFWVPMAECGASLPDLAAVPPDTLRRAKLLWVNFPNNPTGAVASIQDYSYLVSFCREHDLLLASDNPYVDVTYDGYQAGSALQASDAMTCTVEFMSFSKTYNMGGWRLGAAVGQAAALQTLLQVKSNVDSGHFCAVYDAGIVALDQTPQQWINDRNAVYQRRRDQVMSYLPDIGLCAETPKGAIYVWASSVDGDGQWYVEEALQHAQVALAPGEAYGPGGKRHVRISLAVPDERLLEGLNRLKAWYKQR